MPPKNGNYVRWTSWDVLKWKAPKDLGGGDEHLINYKNGWIVFHKKNIKSIARTYFIPEYLLAGIAWKEVGGDPYFIDHVAFYVRAFDWSGPDWVDRNLTMTHNPSRTSFGAVSMQLRVAAKYLGVDPNNLSTSDQIAIISFLDSDVNNLRIVARHLWDLIIYDYPESKLKSLTDEQVRIIATRYNRGTKLKLNDLKRNTSYGDDVVNLKYHLIQLLED